MIIETAKQFNLLTNKTRPIKNLFQYCVSLWQVRVHSMLIKKHLQFQKDKLESANKMDTAKLPATNQKVARKFSTLKITKTYLRPQLHKKTIKLMTEVLKSQKNKQTKCKSQQ
jgi:hypothetical protein